MSRFTPLAGALMVGGLLVASCGADLELSIQESTATPAPANDRLEADGSPQPTPDPTPEVPEGRAPLPDDLLLQPGPRIAIETIDGQIFTVLGDGSNPVPLTNPAEGTHNSAPTWSLDASRLGWITTDQGTGSASVRSARFDGSDWFEQDVKKAPFYLAWDPSSSQIATLGPSDLGLELGVVSLPEQTYRKIDDGSPFWFSWNPDADGFLVHASGLRLDLVPLDGTSQVLESDPGLFQAPRWLDGAVELIYSDQENGEHFLVAAGANGAGRRPLVSYDGYLQFTVAPESGLIALHVIDESRAPTPEVITASFQPENGVDVVDFIPRNELTLMATFGGDPFVLHPTFDELTPDPVLAFYWNPDGTSLAWLTEVDAGSGDCGSETALYEWQFWSDSRLSVGPRFVPSARFACDYIPFFDQLDQSLSFWSPDGALLTYAGTDPASGQSGIWTTEPDAFSSPVLIADGEIGVWSSDVAGSAASSAL